MTYVIPQKGDRIELLEMPEDPCPVEVGTTGTVINVVPLPWTDHVQVWVSWDTQRSLHLSIPPDRIRVL